MVLSYLFALTIVLVPFLFLALMLAPLHRGAQSAVRGLLLLWVVSIILTIINGVGWL